VKKKSPPYAIIGALLLGIICIVAFVKFEQIQKQKADQALADQKAADQKAIDDANAAKQVVVAPTDTNMRVVLYANQPVAAGIRISPAFFDKKLTPNDILPDAYTDKSDIVGFYAVRGIETGDPLTPHNVGKSLPFLSPRISPGMRTISLSIFNAEVNDTGGFIVDGDKVDLLFSTFAADNSTVLKTEMLMQKLNVLFVPGPPTKTDVTDGITPIPPPGDPITVTFEVTPEQAQALVYFSQVKFGRFSMILRSRRDDSVIKIKPFASDDYPSTNFRKVQTMVEKSDLRVQELAEKIEAQEKTQASQGTTNETTTPTPPSP
jgi:Flp pilus assembly protein CpaB